MSEGAKSRKNPGLGVFGGRHLCAQPRATLHQQYIVRRYSGIELPYWFYFFYEVRRNLAARLIVMRSRSLEISRSLSDQSTFMNYFLSSRSEVQAGGGVSKNELAHFEIYRYELIWLVTYFLIQSNADDIHLSQSRFLPRKARTGEQFCPFLAKPAIGQNSDFDQSWRSKTIFWPMATLENGPATDPISLTLLWPSKLTN